MSDQRPLPSATLKAFDQYKDKAPHNPGLLFDRFTLPISREEARKESLQEIVDKAKAIDHNLLDALNQRWQAAAQALGAQTFSLKTEWRLVSGLGRKGALEIGFTFNRFGFPVLPASSVKGLAPAFAFYQLAETGWSASLAELDHLLNLEEDAEFEKALQSLSPAPAESFLAEARDFRTIFGTPGTAGRAIFFEAIPARQPHLQIDLMNPHYPDYYRSQTAPPTNWQNPTPIYFLTVAPQTEFRFAVAWRGAGEPTHLQKAVEFLRQGLLQLGIGAKPPAGYGFFTPPPASTTATGAETTQRASTPAQAPSALPPSSTFSGIGKVVHEGNRTFVVDAQQPARRFLIEWRQLGMDALKKGTQVRYTCEQLPDGKLRLVRLERYFGS